MFWLLLFCVMPGEYEVVAAERSEYLVGNTYTINSERMAMTRADGTHGFSGVFQRQKLVSDYDRKSFRYDLVLVAPGVVRFRVDDCEWLTLMKK